MAKDAISMLKANALAIHVNSIQELVMAEGDRDFSKWLTNIEAIVKGVDVPVIVKEVGYGMHLQTIEALINIGVKYIDLSGKGGTNFTHIESARKGEKDSPFKDFGLSAVESLLIAPQQADVTYFASGGVRNGVDIVKALALNAQAVGMARYFLDLSDLPLEVIKEKLDSLIDDIKKTLVLLNVKTPQEVNRNHIFISPLL
jgi:isopentenyl-diphosphate delta-isomerase